jgi:hypothetical protein
VVPAAGHITCDSRLLLVTSNLHSRHVPMTFRKHGFTNVAVVSAIFENLDLYGHITVRRPKDSHSKIWLKVPL